MLTTLGRQRSTDKEVSVSHCSTFKNVARGQNAVEPNHYAVVALDAAGRELRGWDFKLLTVAKAFANELRQRHSRMEILAQDTYARTLGRLVPALRYGQWIETLEAELTPASHAVSEQVTHRDLPAPAVA